MLDIEKPKIVVLKGYERQPDDSTPRIEESKYPLMLLCPDKRLNEIINATMTNMQFKEGVGDDILDDRQDITIPTENLELPDPATPNYNQIIKDKRFMLLFQPKRVVQASIAGVRAKSKENKQTNYLSQKTRKSGRPKGGEVTIKWKNPETGEFETPQELIQYAENQVSASLIQLIGYEVISRVNTVIKSMEKHKLINGRIAINISHRQFENPQFIENIMRMYIEENVKPSYFELEVTETSKPESIYREALQLARAHYYGLKRAADDVGEGFNTMEYLNNKNIKYCFDTVKISYTKVQDIVNGLKTINENPEDHYLYIENGVSFSSDENVQFYLDLITYAIENGCDVVLEGVKDNDDLVLLYKTVYQLKNSILSSTTSNGIKKMDEWRDISIQSKRAAKNLRMQISEYNILAQDAAMKKDEATYNGLMHTINTMLFDLQKLDRLHHRGIIYKGESIKPVVSVQSYDNDIPKDMDALLRSVNQRIYPAKKVV